MNFESLRFKIILNPDNIELGTLVYRSQLVLPYSSNDDPKNIYMCVKLRGCKKWQSINKVSVKNWSMGRKFISSLDDHANHQPITISNAYSYGNINGTYYPIPMTCRKNRTYVGNNIVYVRNKIMEGENARWLYYKPNEIWIGDTKNMMRRNSRGWLQHQLTTSFKMPWEIKKWHQWDGTRWKLTENIKITIEQNKQSQELENQKKIVKEKEKIIHAHMDVSTLLFNKLKKEERYELLQKSVFRTLFRQVDLCGVCFSKAKITKCIHYDCFGACSTCHNDHKEDNCIACGQKQEVQCPICLDMHRANYVKVFKCRHITCWQCYSNAFEANKPIKNCPLCRKNI